MNAAEGVQVLGPGGPALDLVEGDGDARALVWPGVGAAMRSMHLVSLGAGARTRPQLHSAEAVYYVLEGGGTVGSPGGDGGAMALEPGSMIHVKPGTPYRLEAAEAGLEVVGGPSPPDPALYGNGAAPAAAAADSEGIRTFHRDAPDVMLPMIASDARLVIWAGVGAMTANMNYVSMQPGEENVPHAHDESEDTIYIVSGRGSVEDLTHGFELEFEAGHAIQVPPGVTHRVKANRGSAVVSVGGPCPADLAMLRTAGLLPPGLS